MSAIWFDARCGANLPAPIAEWGRDFVDRRGFALVDQDLAEASRDRKKVDVCIVGVGHLSVPFTDEALELAQAMPATAVCVISALRFESA